MQNSDAFISLRHLKDEDTILDVIEAGMKKNISIYVQSTRSTEMVSLSPAQLQRIRTNHPEKATVISETQLHSSYNKVTDSSYTRRIRLYQTVSYFDLWVIKTEVDELLKKPIVLKKTSSIEKERETMLKMILCMAIDAYNYDPEGEKNSATGKNRTSIKAAIERAGLSIDDNTIRKYLEEAKKMYPQVRTRENKTLHN